MCDVFLIQKEVFNLSHTDTCWWSWNCIQHGRRWVQWLQKPFRSHKDHLLNFLNWSQIFWLNKRKLNPVRNSFKLQNSDTSLSFGCLCFPNGSATSIHVAARSYCSSARPFTTPPRPCLSPRRPLRSPAAGRWGAPDPSRSTFPKTRRAAVCLGGPSASFLAPAAPWTRRSPAPLPPSRCPRSAPERPAGGSRAGRSTVHLPRRAAPSSSRRPPQIQFPSAWLKWSVEQHFPALLGVCCRARGRKSRYRPDCCRVGARQFAPSCSASGNQPRRHAATWKREKCRPLVVINHIACLSFYELQKNGNIFIQKYDFYQTLYFFFKLNIYKFK